MHRILFRALCATLLLGLPAAAQSEPRIANWPTATVDLEVDSGYLHNPFPTARVVFRRTLRFEQTMWTVLTFAEGTNLPTGSTLRIRSLEDGATQTFDGTSIRDYDFRSSGMNGDAVELELVAGPNTRSNRITVAEALRALDTQLTESLCGADDRVPSNDARQGRLVRNGSPGCTAWLIDDNLVLTAGHCTTANMQIEFNVPLSNSNGSPRRSAPNDVYPITLIQSTGSGGVGNDWAVMRVGRNSNTGLTPTEANGGRFYDLGPVPTSTAGQNIRVTGYGSTSSPITPTWNQYQKTHFDRLTQIGGTFLRYIPDTTGGNSGSPVIHENTGHAIGIHTHGGCTSGGNQGTRIDRADLQRVINDNSGTPGDFANFGQGCPGTGQAPQYCAGVNPNGGSLAGDQNANEYAYQLTANSTLTINSVELFTRSASGGSTTINVAIYSAGPSSVPLWGGQMTVGGSAGWYSATVSPAILVPAGTFYVASDNTNGGHVLANLSGGTAGIGFYRPTARTGAWTQSNVIDFPAVRIGCPGNGSGVEPRLGVSGNPRIARRITFELTGAAASTNAFLLIGASNSSWAGGSLPQSLAGFGAPGCDLLVSTEIIQSVQTNANGAAIFNTLLPNDQALVGSRFYQQFLVLDPTVNNLGVVTSNGGNLLVGG